MPFQQKWDFMEFDSKLMFGPVFIFKNRYFIINNILLFYIVLFLLNIFLSDGQLERAKC